MKTIAFLFIGLFLVLALTPITIAKVTGSFTVTEQEVNQPQEQPQNSSQITGQAIADQDQDSEDNFIIKFFKKLFSLFK